MQIAGRGLAAVVVVIVMLAGPASAAGVAPGVPDAGVPDAVVPGRAMATRWAWPVPAPHAVARPFVAPATTYGRGHRGIDIRAPAGTLVRAPASGTVHFAGVVVDRPVVSISHPGGVLSSFEPVQPLVVAGEAVQRGDVIGLLLAGHCAASCLHLGARIDGEYVNPLLFLGGVPRAVLLPMG
jgi:murein DD-endopeptidase MepM/ murein hydrolase activator NlpD